MVRKLALAVLFTLGSAPLSVYGIGLGDMKTYSALNQNFKGEIQLLSVPQGELDTMRVKLASREAFAKVGSEYMHILNRLRFEPVRRKDGSAVILVTSREVIREPFLDFLVEVNWPNGRLVKEYTVLLDPPLTTKRRPAETSKPKISKKRQRAVAPAAQVKPASAQTKAPIPGPTSNMYGPVATNETAWRIAAKLKPQGISIHQMMMALLHANPHAFVNNNVNRLKKGSMLRVPSIEEIRVLDRQDAIASFKQQTKDWRANITKTADAPVAVDSSADSDSDAALPQPAKEEEDARLQIAAARPQAEGEAGASEADAVAEAGNEDIRHELMLARENMETSRMETDELKATVGELESQLQDMKRLLTLQDEQLAQLRARVGSATNESAASGDSAASIEAPREAPLAETELEADKSAVQDQETAEAGAVSEPELAEESAIVGTEPEAIVAAEKPEEPETNAAAQESIVDETSTVAEKTMEIVADGSSQQTSWLEDNLTMIAAAVGGLFGLGVLAAVFRNRRKQPLTEKAAPILTNTSEVDTAINDQQEVDQEERLISEYTAKDKRKSEDHAVEVDPIAAADVYIAYERYDQAQKLLEEEIAGGDNSVSIWHKLLEIYFTTRNVQSFTELAGRMVKDGQDKRDAQVWEHIQDMGKKLDRFNPLFWAKDSKAVHVEENEFNLEFDNKAKEQDSNLGDGLESLGELESLELDFASFGSHPDESETGTAKVETEPDTELEDMVELDDITQSIAGESTGDSDEEITFAEPLQDIGVGDEVDTKLELARAYIEMGDREGAMSILKEVLEDGTDEQMVSASEMLAGLKS